MKYLSDDRLGRTLLPLALKFIYNKLGLPDMSDSVPYFWYADFGSEIADSIRAELEHILTPEVVHDILPKYEIEELAKDIGWINPDYMDLEDTFLVDKLEDWALNHGFVKGQH